MNKWIAKECSECMIPHLNISSHPLKGESVNNSLVFRELYRKTLLIEVKNRIIRYFCIMCRK